MEYESNNIEEFQFPKKFVKIKNLKRKIVSESGEGMDFKHNETQEKFKHNISEQKKPNAESNKSDIHMRKVPVPSHRYTQLKEKWSNIFTPIAEHLLLQVRFNTESRNIEINVGPETKDIGLLQKAADFVKAFIYGFEVEDALPLLRLDDLFVESFEVKDVKNLRGDHLCRAIGRIAGKAGRTKCTIENVTKTRIVLADSHIHILGSFQNIAFARRAISALIMGTSASKVFENLKYYGTR